MPRETTTERTYAYRTGRKYDPPPTSRTTARKGKRAVIYCRISRDIEGKRLGVKRQEKECRELCERKGLEVIAVLVDNDLSAFNRKLRPDYQKALEMMRLGMVDVLVGWASDRITRHPIELEELIDVLNGNAIEVHTVVGGEIDLQTTDGRTMARIMGTLARAESERKSERVRAKYRQMRESGLPSGGQAPYGYRRVDKMYVVDPETSAHLRWMVNEVLAGVSLQTVTDTLNENEIPSYRGGKWHPGRVKRSITNPAITALVEYAPKDKDGKQLPGEIIGEAQWEPILDRNTWDAVCAILMDPVRMRDKARSKYPLTGLLYSFTDKKAMRGNREDPTKSAGPKLRVYTNTTAYLQAEEAEGIVFATALKLIEAGDFRGEARLLEAEDTDALQAELDELMRLKNAGRISLAEWLELRDPVQARLEAALARQQLQRPTLAILQDPARLRAKWQAEDEDRGSEGDYSEEQFKERRAVAMAVFEKIWVHRATKARWTPTVDRLEFLTRQSGAPGQSSAA
jgi:DNA invertase Pin-like site-specific DNA recombinase